jgi:hypothetical protein
MKSMAILHTREVMAAPHKELATTMPRGMQVLLLGGVLSCAFGCADSDSSAPADVLAAAFPAQAATLG